MLPKSWKTRTDLAALGFGFAIGAQFHAYFLSSPFTLQEHAKLLTKNLVLHATIQPKALRRFAMTNTIMSIILLMDQEMLPTKALACWLFVFNFQTWIQIVETFDDLPSICNFENSLDCMQHIRLTNLLQTIVVDAILMYKNLVLCLANITKLALRFRFVVKKLYVLLNPDSTLHPPYIRRLIFVFELLDVLFSNASSYVTKSSLQEHIIPNVVDIVQSYTNVYSQIPVSSHPLVSLQFCKKELRFCETSLYEVLKALQ